MAQTSLLPGVRLGQRVLVENISRVFPDGSGLNQTSFDIPAGEFWSILGPSGCGKSTLLRLLAGLDTPDTGSITIGDSVVFDIERVSRSSRSARKLGMVFQDLALWPHLSVFENVAFPLRVTKVPRSDIGGRVDDALSLVGMDEMGRKLPHQLSGGQQQRVAIARAIVARPELLLMDEPLSALDAELRTQLRYELRALVESVGITTIYVTHDQIEAMSMADRVVVLRQGNVVQLDTPQGLYDRPADREVAGFVGALNEIPDTTVGWGVRPEKSRLVTSEDSGPVVTAVVRDSHYAGGQFLVRCDVPGVRDPWTVPSSRSISPGSPVVVGYHMTDVLGRTAKEIT